MTKTRGNARYRRGYTKAPSEWRRTCGGSNDGSDFVEDAAADNDVVTAALALERCRAAMASTLSSTIVLCVSKISELKQQGLFVITRRTYSFSCPSKSGILVLAQHQNSRIYISLLL